MRNQQAPIGLLGGAGFIGAAVVRRLAKRPGAIRATIERDQPRWHIDDIDCQWVDLEAMTPQVMRRFVRGTAAIIDCRGFQFPADFSVSDARRRGVEQLRVVGDACLAEGVRRLIYLSSSATICDRTTNGPRRDETNRYTPGEGDDPYFEARSAMEAELYRYAAAGLEVVVLIPTLVLGPGEASPVTGALLGAVAGGRMITAAPSASINVVDVRDVARGVVAAVQRGRPGRRYVLGGTDLELVELLSSVGQRCNQSVRPLGPSGKTVNSLLPFGRRLVGRLGGDRSARLLTSLDVALRCGPVDTSRARGELNYSVRNLDMTVEDTLRWLIRIGYLSWSGTDDCLPSGNRIG